MGILATFEKQPLEIQDFDIDFAAYLADMGNDTLLSHVVVADTGITVQLSQIVGTAVKVWLTGGTDEVTYQVTARVTTTGGRVHEGDIKVKVKES